MNRIIKQRLAVGALLASSLMLGCGGGGANNDQGVSFQLIGFAATPCGGGQGGQGGGGGQVAGQSEIVVFLSEGFESQDEADFDTTTCAQLQNNMTTQFVRTERVFVEYYVEGATKQPPSTSSLLPVSLAPIGGVNGVGVGGGAQGGEGQVGQPTGSGAVFPPQGAPGSTLPPSLGGGQQGGAGGGQGGQQGGQGGGVVLANSSSAEFSILPATVKKWMVFNRDSLPNPPFQMEMIVYACGTTSSGDELCTNQLGMTGYVKEDRRPILGGSASTQSISSGQVQSQGDGATFGVAQLSEPLADDSELL